MTTDTALLVSKEILEEKKILSDLEFTTDPEIPTDPSVQTYLDFRFPIEKLVNNLKLDSHQMVSENLDTHMHIADLSNMRKQLIDKNDIQ
jgi:ribosome biogenesis SPOUT family RNA methylase Rps3